MGTGNSRMPFHCMSLYFRLLALSSSGILLTIRSLVLVWKPVKLWAVSMSNAYSGSQQGCWPHVVCCWTAVREPFCSKMSANSISIGFVFVDYANLVCLCCVYALSSWRIVCWWLLPPFTVSGNVSVSAGFTHNDFQEQSANDNRSVIELAICDIPSQILISSGSLRHDNYSKQWQNSQLAQSTSVPKICLKLNNRCNRWDVKKLSKYNGYFRVTVSFWIISCTVDPCTRTHFA